MKDILGNDLEAGDLVMLNVGNVNFVGRVKNLKPGGLAVIAGGKHNNPNDAQAQQVTAATLDVQITYSCAVDPRQPLFQQLMKVVDGNPAGKAEFLKALQAVQAADRTQ